MNQLSLWQEKEEQQESQIINPEILAAKMGIKPGQIYILDSGKGTPHRVAIGDCRDEWLLKRLFVGKKAVIFLSDGPYGAGKERDGITNDNLKGKKLDAFTLECWKAGRPHITNNASGYIWGYDEDLWRLWYLGGLKDSEKITFKNMIVWDKRTIGGGSASLIGNECIRSYPPAGGERCLFFVLGAQEISNNADNYWEGWEPIRSYLHGEIEKLKQQTGMSLEAIGGYLGISGRAVGHWISKSQWSFVPEGHYLKLQELSNTAFKDSFGSLKDDYEILKTSYRELKKQFNKTRYYFDNSEPMTDVWFFPIVQNKNRFGFPTPKHPGLSRRIVTASSPKGSITYSPFLGSGTDIIACELESRICYGVEVKPKWAALSIRRWEITTGRKAILEVER
jgi:hypothetical protein